MLRCFAVLSGGFSSPAADVKSLYRRGLGYLGLSEAGLAKKDFSEVLAAWP